MQSLQNPNFLRCLNRQLFAIIFVAEGLGTRAMEKKNPQLYIIAGPNGAGKTTFAKKFLPQYANCNNFVNADLIAGGLSPFSPRSVAIKAGKLLLGEIHNLAEKKLDSWCLFDNSTDIPCLIAKEKESHLAVMDAELFTKISR